MTHIRFLLNLVLLVCLFATGYGQDVGELKEEAATATVSGKGKEDLRGNADPVPARGAEERLAEEQAAEARVNKDDYVRIEEPAVTAEPEEPTIVKGVEEVPDLSLITSGRDPSDFDVVDRRLRRLEVMVEDRKDVVDDYREHLSGEHTVFNSINRHVIKAIRSWYIIPHTDVECFYSFTRERCEPHCECEWRPKFGDYSPRYEQTSLRLLL